MTPPTWLQWLLAWVVLYAVGSLLLVVAARRLPPGPLRDLAAFLPACVTAARRLRRSPDVPVRAKVALLVAVLWVLSPVDLIPEFLPVVGPLDDVVVVVLLLRYAARSVPRPVLLAAWPAEPHLLERVLDGRLTSGRGRARARDGRTRRPGRRAPVRAGGRRRRQPRSPGPAPPSAPPGSRW